NSPPSVSITNPANGATFSSGSAINIQASASDSDGSVSKVEFFINGAKIGEDTSSPYSFSWSNAQTGSYSLIAQATDNNGARTNASVVSMSVGILQGGAFCGHGCIDRGEQCDGNIGNVGYECSSS